MSLLPPLPPHWELFKEACLLYTQLFVRWESLLERLSHAYEEDNPLELELERLSSLCERALERSRRRHAAALLASDAYLAALRSAGR